MKHFLHPAIWLCGRLSFRLKLLAGFLLFVIPLALVIAFLLHEGRNSIERIALQRQGLALQVPTLGLIRSAQDHYAASQAAFHGDMALQAGLATAKSEFARHATSVLTHPLSGDAGRRIDRQWQQLVATPPTDADASRNAHEALLTDLFALRDDVVDRSGLALNDDVAVQTLVELLDGQLVPLIANLGQARDVGVGIIARGRISAAQREAMSIIRGSFNSLLGWMDQNVEKSVRREPAVQGPLVERMQALGSATLGVQEFLTTKLINTSDFDGGTADFYARGNVALDAGRDLTGELVSEIDTLLTARTERIWSLFTWALVGFGFGVALLAYLFAGAYASILRSIRELERAAHAMADGDLRTHVEVLTRDEIGQVGAAFNTMATSFSQLIGKVAAAAGATRNAASELTRQAGHVTTASARQSDAAAQSSSSVQQLAVSFQQVYAHAQDTSRIVSRAAELSAEGRAIADEAAGEMRLVEDGIAAAVEAVLSLEQRSRTVDRVVGVIAEIADQTNLLALNAAIEAARAGDVGRGFAVVADEVRKLADRTGNSTREIADTVRDMRDAIRGVVADIQKGSGRVGESSASFARVAAALDAIHREVTHSATLVDEIVVATQAQTEAGNDIARSIENMSTMADENHATARKTGSAVDDLLQLAGGLRLAVEGLKV